jgi:hypothetical protein
MSVVHQQLLGYLHTTRSRLGLASIVQKKRESLHEFIQHFWNKRNIIPEVDDKSNIIFFKKGLRDSSLIRKLTMKNPRTSEEMLAITKKYALAKEVTQDNKYSKKHKELGHSDQASTSKSNDKKRKSDRSMANVECSRHNKEYQPQLGEFEGLLNIICIYHP